MIGRVYHWRDADWIVLTRGKPFDRGPRRNVLLERVEVWGTDDRDADVECRDGVLWCLCGERMVRPFRGLKRSCR